jgi:hypothetical protein
MSKSCWANEPIRTAFAFVQTDGQHRSCRVSGGAPRRTYKDKVHWADLNHAQRATEHLGRFQYPKYAK